MFKTLILSATLVVASFAFSETATAQNCYGVNRGFSGYRAPIGVYGRSAFASPVQRFNTGFGGGFYGVPHRSFYGSGFGRGFGHPGFGPGFGNFGFGSGFGHPGFGRGFGHPGFGRGGIGIGFGF